MYVLTESLFQAANHLASSNAAATFTLLLLATLLVHTTEARSKNTALNQISNKFFEKVVRYIYQSKMINLANNFVADIMVIKVGHESH